MNTTPPCPVGLFEFMFIYFGIDLVGHFEYSPFEKGSVDSMGAPYEPDVQEAMNLISVYVNGSDYDIAEIVAVNYLEDLEIEALAHFKDYK